MKRTTRQRNHPIEKNELRRKVQPTRNYRNEQRAEELDIVKQILGKPIPPSLFISDAHAGLVKVYADRSDHSDRANRLRGAIVDIREGRVIKYPPSYKTIHARNDTDLESLIDHLYFEATRDKPQQNQNIPYEVNFSPVYDGSLVTAFKYQGEYYFATGRSLGINPIRHIGAYPIRHAMMHWIGNYLLDMFGEDPTSPWYYDFMLISQFTTNVTKAATSESIVYMGTGRLSLDPESVRQTLKPFDIGAVFREQEAARVAAYGYMESEYFPTQVGFYQSRRFEPSIRSGVTEADEGTDEFVEYETALDDLEVAQEYFDGVITGYPESVLVTFTFKDPIRGDQEHMFRIEPIAYTRRHAIRGDIQHLGIRFLEILRDARVTHIGYAPEEGIQAHYSHEPEPWIIEYQGHQYQSEGQDRLQAIYYLLRESIPWSRHPELDQAYEMVEAYLEKLSRSLAAVLLHNKLYTFLPSDIIDEMKHEYNTIRHKKARANQNAIVNATITQYLYRVLEHMSTQDITTSLIAFQLIPVQHQVRST